MMLKIILMIFVLCSLVQPVIAGERKIKATGGEVDMAELDSSTATLVEMMNSLSEVQRAYRAGNFKESDHLWEKAQKQFPKMPELRTSYLMMLIGHRDFKRARIVADQAIKDFSDNSNLKLIQERLGQMEQAKDEEEVKKLTRQLGSDLFLNAFKAVPVSASQKKNKE